MAKIKTDSELYRIVHSAISQVLAHYYPNGIPQAQKDGIRTERGLWAMYHTATDQLRYDDNHPMFTGYTDSVTNEFKPGRTRIIEYNPSFSELLKGPDGTGYTDNAKETLIKSIIKDLVK